LLSDAEAFGNLGQDRAAMFLEGINMVLDIWAKDPPYGLKGKYWNVTTEKTYWPEIGQGIIPKPFQRPHPPIAVTAVAPHSKGVTEAAARGWLPISANFLMPCWVKSHWPKYVEGCTRAGLPVDSANWRVAKSIFVADNDATAREYATGEASPYRFYYRSLMSKLLKNGRSVLFKEDPAMADDAVTLDYVTEKLVFHGSVNRVVDQILAFREEVGDFGTLLTAGKDWRDPKLARRSMQLMAEQVMPRVNAAIAGERRAAE
jgi:alkanesulfonate monooxygenase SsuD/methylene tetrahydromethanopterin reductase-like flavin-dependent oxidoreductase (luciferase family)